MALHFGGYEFVRSGMLALFTSSSRVGLANNVAGAFPLAMGLVSPCSVLLLMGYNQILEREGPRTALRTTTGFSWMVFALLCTILTLLQPSTTTIATATGGGGGGVSLPVVVSQAVVALGFIYQNAYAHLLYT